MTVTIYPILSRIETRTTSKTEIRLKTSELARQLVSVSAQKAGLPLTPPLQFFENGAPKPFHLQSQHTYWSLSHSHIWTAAVAARFLVGIDLEIRERQLSAELKNRIVQDAERSLFSRLSATQHPDELVRLFWICKEATTKATGAGFGDFKKCIVKDILNGRATIEYRDHGSWILHISTNADVMIAVAHPVLHTAKVEWLLEPSLKETMQN